MLSETRIVKAVNGKDEKAWKILFDTFYVPLCHYALRILRDKQLVADIVQDVFVRLWNSDVRFENEKALTVYLYRSVANNSLKYLRDKHINDRRLKQWQEEGEEDMSEENFSEVVREEVFRKLRELINQLPNDRREIMLMSLEGMSGEEIAMRLGISIHTVKQQKYRAYKFIRERMGKYWWIVFIFFLR